MLNIFLFHITKQRFIFKKMARKKQIRFDIFNCWKIQKAILMTRKLLFSCSVMSDFLWPHGLQHSRLPCLPLSPGVCSNSCPLSWWCHPTISSSVVSFSSCPQSFPASGSFPMSWLFLSDNQSIGASASVPVLKRTK